MPDPSHPELASGVAAAREIVACAERTLAAPSARIQLHKELRFPPRERLWPRGLPGVMRRVAGGTAKLLGTAWWKYHDHRLKATGGLKSGYHLGVGIAEPAQGRYMIDYGLWAELHADGKTVRGRSGRALQALRNSRWERPEEVLWLVRLLPGTTDAALEGTDTLHGTLCQRLAAHVDLARASAASGAGLRPPLVERFEDLSALPVTVWIDGQHVRRIRSEHDLALEFITTTLDLWEFGVPAGDLDWSRLPTFRSTGYQQERG
jgi:hypothetical protein